MRFPVANPLREETRMHFSAATLLPKESMPARDPPSLAPRNCTSAEPGAGLAADFCLPSQLCVSPARNILQSGQLVVNVAASCENPET
jgi:hypothetical protein